MTIETRPGCSCLYPKKPLFLAWIGVTIFFDSLIVLFLSDIWFQVVLRDSWTGNGNVAVWARWLMFLLVTAKVTTQALLAVHKLARALIWILTTVGLLSLAYFNFEEIDFFVPDERSVVMFPIAIFQGFLLYGVARDFGCGHWQDFYGQ